MTTIGNIFQQSCIQYGNNFAVQCNELCYTYSNLNTFIISYSNYLITECNVNKGDNVIVCLSNSIELVVVLLSLTNIGATWIPLSKDLPNIDNIIEDSNAKLVIKDLKLHEIVISELTSELNIRMNQITLDDQLFLIYSSGTTGKPKGIFQSQRSFLSAIKWRHNIVYENTEDDNMLCYIFFVWEFLRPLLKGGCIHVIDKLTFLDINKLIKYIKQKNISDLQLTPSFARVFCKYLLDNEINITNLKVLWLCGEVVDRKLCIDLLTCVNNCKIVNLYSISEAPDIGVNIINDNYDYDINPITTWFEGSEKYIEDNILYISCPTVSENGYHNRPDKNDIIFFNKNGRRWLKTCDNVTELSNDVIVIKGRADFMIKIRGYSVQIDELEILITQLCNATKSIVYYDDDKDILIVEIFNSQITEIEAIKDKLSTVLPPYAIPTTILLDGQNNDKLLNSSGKIERHTDCPLADIWFKILDCHPKFTDDFFMIGGTSIKSILLANLINKAYKTTFGPRDIILNPKLYQQVELIRNFSVLNNNNINDDIYSELEDTLNIVNKFQYNGKFVSIPDASNILVTGASGYLGTWLTKILTEKLNKHVTVMVRSYDNWLHTINTIYNTTLNLNNITIIDNIDLSKPNLGLANYDDLTDKFDCIIHCAGLVNLAVSYQKLQEVNKNGIINILGLCQNACLHFVSSNAIYPSNFGDCNDSLFDELLAKINNPYGKSKWFIEYILRKLTLPWVITRPGNIGPTKDGQYNPNDFQMILLQKCISINATIDSEELKFEYTPVEFVINEMLKISLNHTVTNIVNNIKLKLCDIPLNKLNFKKWKNDINDESFTKLLEDINIWLDDKNNYISKINEEYDIQTVINYMKTRETIVFEG